MPTFIGLLRAVNVSGKNRLPMDGLRRTCEELGFTAVRTYIQSGNVVFESESVDCITRLEKAIESSFGFRPLVVSRSVTELRNIVERNPLPGVPSNRLVVYFLNRAPEPEEIAAVKEIELRPEEVHITGSEMYVYFPNGQGESKLPVARIEKALNARGTGRNWNSVLAILAMAERDQ